MANFNLARGGTPDFKGWLCDGQYPEYGMPFDAPNQAGTPPFDSHADGAWGQGYLNIAFPLVPNLDGTEGHRWMKTALKGVSAVNDVIFTNWLPYKSYLESLYLEVKTVDANLTGVYIEPVAFRATYDEDTDTTTYTEIAAFATELTTAGIDYDLPLGTPLAADKRAIFARLSNDADARPATFGSNVVGDASFGAVIIGLRITAGSADAIKKLADSNVAVYLAGKLICFDSPSQIG